MKVIPSLKYCREHTWVKIEGEYAYIGITDYAQDQLGEILFVEMPEVEDEITKGEDFGVVESSKVASDLIAPISGEVVEELRLILNYIVIGVLCRMYWVKKYL